jgi:hypothetical protein
MRACIAILLCCGSGCTMLSLERHTVAQSASTGDLRYREVMDNLAMSAANPSALPYYATIYSGSAQVSDTFGAISTTTWQHVVGKNGFGSEAFNPSEQRQIIENWTLDPVVYSAKLEAMRACAKWVLFGPNSLNEEEMSLLINPDAAPPGPNPHFDVADRLANLPSGWVHIGRLCDVPACACYKAHCAQTWAWVEGAGMQGLADYTLVLQSIGRVDPNSPTLFNFGPAFTYVKFLTLDSPVTTPEGRYVRMYAQVYLDSSGRLMPDTPYFAAQQSDQQSLSHLRSVINLAVPVPH